MSDMIYLQTEKNVKITSEHVYLQDIATVSGNNPKVISRCKSLKVKTLPKEKYGRYTVTAIDLVALIERHIEHVDITHIGEPKFLLTYEKPEKKINIWNWGKTIFVCLIIFFGSMFSIMTFHTDIGLTELFHKIYFQVTGSVSDGFTVLEIAYSIGIGLGVIFFFNHFGKFRLSKDPTPMEMEMRTYEDEVDTTIMEKEGREVEQSCTD